MCDIAAIAFHQQKATGKFCYKPREHKNRQAHIFYEIESEISACCSYPSPAVKLFLLLQV